MGSPEADSFLVAGMMQVLVNLVDGEVRTFPLEERHKRHVEYTYKLMATVWGGFPGFPREPGRPPTATELNGLILLDAIQAAMPRTRLPASLRAIPPQQIENFPLTLEA